MLDREVREEVSSQAGHRAERLRGEKGRDLASGEAVPKVLQGLGQDADFSSRDGAEPVRAKATKGQVRGRKRCQLNSD